jgi:CheY-like chemotaxis protein
VELSVDSEAENEGGAIAELQLAATQEAHETDEIRDTHEANDARRVRDTRGTGEAHETRETHETNEVHGTHHGTHPSAAYPLTRHIANTQSPSQQQPGSGFTRNNGLEGKTVLLADDDFRNVFALTGVLESYGMNVLYAENGREAIEMLNRHRNVDGVLMDIMMPEMDGYESIRLIRKMNKFRHLPILAVTAKAMKDDREKCLQAGASDYISKPIDVDKLMSLLKIWLFP